MKETTTIDDLRPDEVHAFWFGDVATRLEQLPERKKFWFMSGRSLDPIIIERFGDAIEPAARGEFDHWQATPAGTLALIVVLDQFPRHVHRGSARAFAFDERARTVTRAGVERGDDRALSPVERTFFYLPLEHAESLSAHDEMLRLLDETLAQTTGAEREFVESALRFARDHRAIIEQFGRYPHRNESLDRPSTAAEQVFLDSGGQRFGQ